MRTAINYFSAPSGPTLKLRPTRKLAMLQLGAQATVDVPPPGPL